MKRQGYRIAYLVYHLLLRNKKYILQKEHWKNEQKKLINDYL